MRLTLLVLAVVFACVNAAFADDATQPEQQSESPEIGSKQSDLQPPAALQPPTLASMEQQPAKIAGPAGPWAGNPSKFFAGAFTGFLGHETGHLIANTALNTNLYLMPVHYGPVPFFTIQPDRPLTRREHYITASAGFNATNVINEWLLVSHPRLSQEDKPFLKGMASFNFWLNAGYIATAFAGTGPDERDTKGMADALGWPEWTVGAMVMVPTGLDTYRYKHPDAKWAATLSRIAKLYMIFLAVSADD